MVAPASESLSPPITLDSCDCASAPAIAAICSVSSPWPPATAQASVSSSRFLQASRAWSGRSSYFSEAAKFARTWVVSVAIVVSLRDVWRDTVAASAAALKRGSLRNR